MDTTAVIGFLEEIEGAGLLKILDEMGFDLLVCFPVNAEVVRESTRTRMKALSVLKTASREDLGTVARLRAKYPRLGAGEIGVIAQGLRCKADGSAYLCALDDKKARAAAGAEGLELTGCVGLIRRIAKAGHLSSAEAEKMIQDLTAGGFRYKAV